ncbi:SDR family oxidoreductase [Allohahella sp. A8]|uniref:SDR family oxidoreductase n=1 Tax=Allohahella sp. A8 TaxID=3141461 RepID=UPI003A80CE00
MSRRSIVITGASDGIGKALAFEMAERGYDLGLTARRLERLEAIAEDIAARYPETQIAVEALDVTAYETVQPVFDKLAGALGKIDIVLANAGIARGGKVGTMPLADNLMTIDTNVNGAIATVSAALKIFRQQGHGHLVATSSLAAYRGMPRNAAYCASKAALSTFMEAVRAETYKEKIAVTVLHPGYIDTEINRHLKSRPFLITVEKGAKIFADLIEKKVARATVPVHLAGVLRPLLKLLPTRLIARMG